METYWILIGIFVFILLIIVILCNSLIMSKNSIKYAYSSINALLKKRFDLIPNLIAVTKQYMAYEQNLLDRVVSLRESLKNSHNSNQIGDIDKQSKAIVSSIFARAENYPDLKASNNML